jgi:hypothetical protein
MKRYLTVYDSSKNYLYPSKEIATPELVSQHYPLVNMGIKCVIETDSTGLMFYTSPESLDVLRGIHEIDESLTDEDALTAIEEILNTPEEVNTEPTAEERIAAALEYQNLLSTIDTTTTD